MYSRYLITNLSHNYLAYLIRCYTLRAPSLPTHSLLRLAARALLLLLLAHGGSGSFPYFSRSIAPAAVAAAGSSESAGRCLYFRCFCYSYRCLYCSLDHVMTLATHCTLLYSQYSLWQKWLDPDLA